MPLSDTRLRSVRATGARFELPDRDGLVLRISQKGVMTWTVTFRVQGEGESAGERVAKLSGAKKRLALGEYPTVNLAEARAKALAAKRLARGGVDPSISRELKREKVVRVSALIDRYTAEHLNRNIKNGGTVEKVLRHHVSSSWSEREIESITRGDFVTLLEQVRQPKRVRVEGRAGSYNAIRGGPGAAAEVRKWVRGMFQFAVDAGLLTDNPLTDVRNRDRQKSRTRVLSMDELRIVWRASGEMGYPWGPFFRLIMLTGDRRSEWANARAEWIVADGARLEIPAVHYKTGKTQVVPLSRQAQAIVRALPAPQLGPFILSSTGGERPVSGFSRARRKLDELVVVERGGAMEDWVVHDLRRSMATHMERLGVAPHIIEVCLGHSLKGVAATYRHYSYLAEKAAALQLWADELAS